MDQIARTSLSPYRVFSIEEWAKLRADTPMTLTADEIGVLRSLGHPLSLDEAERGYLPISRLLSFHVSGVRRLFHAIQNFLGTNDAKVPFIIGIGGSVAVGKSTTARVLRELLKRWPSGPKADLVTTDGFLFPNAVLKAEGRMERKGFPESYDVSTLLAFLTDVKAGKPHVEAPVYSHLTYDIVAGEEVELRGPDIVIVEGLNVLQITPGVERHVSDFFDFTIYVDADEADIERWFVERFFTLRETVFADPQSFFHNYAALSDDDAREMAQFVWRTINGVNLREEILPTRARAQLVLEKGPDHRVKRVRLRR